MERFTGLFDLSDKVAIVTGAASGLGEAIAEGYGEYGAIVAVVDINEDGAVRVAEKIISKGGQAKAFSCDISKSDDVRLVISKVLENYGFVNVSVNNAGIDLRSEAQYMTDEMWDNVLDINLKGTFLFCREVGREMIKRGKGGRIINMSSIGGVVGVDTGNANYCASKGGIIAMSRCLAIEWSKYNILVNAIAPSHIRTPLIEKLMSEKPEVKQYFLNNIPLGRLGEAEDIVGPAILLASQAGAFVTGHVFLVDGGHTAK